MNMYVVFVVFDLYACVYIENSIIFDKAWRKRNHALSLPLYQVINNRQTAKNLFPNLHENHGKFLSFTATKTLRLVNSASGNLSTSKIILQRYLKEKRAFHSAEEFIVYKLNELEVATKNGTKVPNVVRTSMICDLFETLSNTDQYSSPIMDRLKLELYRSIYGQNSAFVNEFTIQSQGKMLPPKLQIPTRTFFKLKPFFQQLEYQSSTGIPVRTPMVNTAKTLESSHSKHKKISVSNQGNKKENDHTNDAENVTDKETGKLAIKNMKASTASITNTTSAQFYPTVDILRLHFNAWKIIVENETNQKIKMKAKIKVSMKKHVFKLRRIHFLAWKDYLYKSKLSVYQVNEFKLKKKLEDSQRAAITLLKKSAIAEQQIARVRQLRQASDINQHQALEKRMVKLELELITEKLQHARRKLKTLESCGNMVYSPLLFSQGEQRRGIKLDALLSEEIVMRWVNYHLNSMLDFRKKSDRKLMNKVTNLNYDFANCSVLFLLMHKLRGETNIDYDKISLCNQINKRKKVIQMCLNEMREFLDDFDGLITYGDVFHIHSDIIFVFLVTVMQNYPMLPLTNSHVKNVFSKIDMCLLKLQNNTSDEIGNLQETMQQSETILNQSDRFIESIYRSHQIWLAAVNKCQKKAIQCFAARRFGNSVYVHSENEAKLIHSNPNGLLYLTYIKLRSIIRKNRNNHVPPDDNTPMTPRLLPPDAKHVTESDNNKTATSINPSVIESKMNSDDNSEDSSISGGDYDEYSVCEISQILGCKVKYNISKEEKQKLIEDILTLKECEVVIQEYFHHIRECFRYYASTSTSDNTESNTLSFDEVKMLLKETKVYDNQGINDKVVINAYKLSDMKTARFVQKFHIQGFESNNKTKTDKSKHNKHGLNDLKLPPKLQNSSKKQLQSDGAKHGDLSISINNEEYSIETLDDMSFKASGPASKKALNKFDASLQLTLFEFLEFLVRIAYRKYPSKKASLPDKLRLLLNNYIIRNSASGDQLRDRIQQQDIQNVLSSLDSQLNEAFRYFGSVINTQNKAKEAQAKDWLKYKSGKNIKKQKSKSSISDKNNIQSSESTDPKITFDQFCGMLDELQLISSNFTRATFKNVFKRAMFTNESNVGGRSVLRRKSNNKEYLDYVSFLEALVVVAMYKKPDPYLPLATRLEEFLILSVLNPLFHMGKISKCATIVS